MYHASYEHCSKGLVKYKDSSGTTKTKRAPSCVNRFRYITRTAQYANRNDHENEVVEYVKSGNMPSFCTDRPDQFWEAAELHERKNGRTATSLVLALPKELSVEQRIELVEQIVQQFTEEYNFPYTVAIHNHPSEITGEDQPHLHLMYSERSVDEHDRTADQFFKRYNDKDPAKGGAQKITADVRGEGKDLVNLIRASSEVLINESLEQHAPTKIMKIKGIEVEVPNIVSCLSHADYNKKFGTELKPVPQIPKSLLHLDPNLTFDDDEKNREYQQKLAEREALIQKVQEIRDYNNMELYGHYYYAALQKQNEAKKQQQQDIERVSASDLAYRLDLITYQATADKVKQIRQLSALQDDRSINYIEAIEHKASLLNDVLIKENRKEVSALVCEIYKHDLDTIREHSSSESMSYDEKRISERLNERISTIEHILDRSTRTEQKVENTQKYDDSDNTFRP
ncbi:MobA/MobL family protein [Acinetobacter sp. YH12251]|uniref:MobA/MobL family protein n=1 Tax=Acinetobacter sp. YH12251 TaxID=2601176 RepID=UPI0015D1905D|nr:MobA/MobL family protein [Acinetobacter sp. YH12251]